MLIQRTESELRSEKRQEKVTFTHTTYQSAFCPIPGMKKRYFLSSDGESGEAASYSPDHLPPENSSFLERGFICRFRCLLDNSSGFLVGQTFQNKSMLKCLKCHLSHLRTMPFVSKSDPAIFVT